MKTLNYTKKGDLEYIGDREIVLNLFEGKDLLEKFPDAKPVEVESKETNGKNYFPASPTHPDIRTELIEHAKQIAKKDSIEVIWLNNLQFPTKWNEPEPTILDTDYSDQSLKMFEEFIGEPIEGKNLEEKFLHIDGSYYHEWLKFKTGKITSMAQELKTAIQSVNKNIKVGFFAIPWKDDDYGAAIKRIAGQDFEKLGELMDLMAVMMYQKDLDKDANWVGEMVDYFWHVGKHFTSIVQDDENLDEIIKKASRFPAERVCVKEFVD